MHFQSKNGNSVNDTQGLHSEALLQRMGRMYWLAYLITGDQEQSMQAFGAALAVCEDLARKSFIAAALKEAEEQLRDSIARFETLGDLLEVSAEAPFLQAPESKNITSAQLQRALLAINVFPRCSVLLTVFERLTDPEASTLLQVDEQQLKLARAQGLLELTRNMSASAATPGEVFPQAYPSKKLCRAGLN